MSEIRANTVSNAAGTGPVTLTGQSAAKAWVDLNGSGTVAVRNSFNVASVTDNGTGRYQLNLSNAFSAKDFAFSGSCGTDYFGNSSLRTSNPDMVNGSASAFEMLTSYIVSGSNRTSVDEEWALGIAHGDLA